MATIGTKAGAGRFRTSLARTAQVTAARRAHAKVAPGAKVQSDE
jgi:hypothetical protein